jgi:molybdopterin/thiamine biosynthesis adenylyltransferase
MDIAVSSLDSLSPDWRRYRRQIILSDWGIETQKKLQRAKVLVAGAGGLGCPAALNLALAGVGHIVVCDADAVEISNLNRQFLHTEQSLGTDKVRSAQSTLSSINSEVRVEPIRHKITDKNVGDIVGDAQIIIDCMDNFSARRALNRCAISKGIPLVHGAIWGMEGRVTFLHPPGTPCLQAVEAIKYLANLGETLSGRLLILDCSTMRFQELQVRKNPQCPDCGQLVEAER